MDTALIARKLGEIAAAATLEEAKKAAWEAIDLMNDGSPFEAEMVTEEVAA